MDCRALLGLLLSLSSISLLAGSLSLPDRLNRFVHFGRNNKLFVASGLLVGAGIVSYAHAALKAQRSIFDFSSIGVQLTAGFTAAGLTWLATGGYLWWKNGQRSLLVQSLSNDSQETEVTNQEQNSVSGQFQQRRRRSNYLDSMRFNKTIEFLSSAEETENFPGDLMRAQIPP